MACYKAFQMILVSTILLNTASTILFKNYAAYARIIQDIQNADDLQSDNSVHPRLSELPTVLRERFQKPRRSSSERIIPVPVPPLPKFQEAPAFRNGKECAAMISSTAPYEQQQQRRQNQAEEQQLCDATSVHIAMTLDAVYLRGLVAAVQSILQHAACPENVVFHFVASSRHRELRTKLLTTFPYLRFQLYNFDEALVKHRISNSIRKALDQPLNYARIYLADILPNCVGRVIYLDSDLIVVDDISKLWTSSLGGRVLAAPEYCHANFTKYFTDLFWNDAALSSTFQGRKACYFNTGVMVIDLVLWRRGSYTAKIQEWMELQKERRIYELGSLPPFLLVFAGRVQAVPHRWNQHGLGGDNFEGRCRDLHPGPVSLLHWSGKGKPWNRLDNNTPCPLDALWSPYDLLQKHTYFEA